MKMKTVVAVIASCALSTGAAQAFEFSGSGAEKLYKNLVLAGAVPSSAIESAWVNVSSVVCGVSNTNSYADACVFTDRNSGRKVYLTNRSDVVPYYIYNPLNAADVPLTPNFPREMLPYAGYLDFGLFVNTLTCSYGYDLRQMKVTYSCNGN